MRVLLVEDDKKLCESLSYQLEQEGFSVTACYDGEEGLHWMKQESHDLILLDRMLPFMNGVEVLTRVRNLGITTPVILLTALGELQDKIDGLDAGADDYIVKPFEFRELLARMRSAARRPRQWIPRGVLEFGDLVMYPDEKRLSCSGLRCDLSKREAALMELLLKNPEQTLPRILLMNRVWGPDAEVEDGNLDNYVHFLRRRLKAVNSRLVIRTVRGIGYSLEDPDV